MNMPRLKIEQAFTLIELLVVISIITLLMAVFGLSANKINHISRNLRQKAQIHSMEVGLALFHKDFGDFPSSSYVNAGGKYVYGAQHMTEALFGRDLRGIEVNSRFHDTTDGYINNVALTDYYDSKSDVSRNRRKGPYMHFGGTGVRVVYMTYGPVPLYQPADLGNIYDNAPPTANPNFSDYKTMAPVITDVYKQKKVEFADGTTDYVGTPVLYFKAKRGSKFFKPKGESYPATDKYYSNWLYDWQDNYGFYKLPNLQDAVDPLKTHRFNDAYTDTQTGFTGVKSFYNFITNSKVGSYEAAQNAESFIIISAGRDGVYGTKDDITNFDN